MASLARKTPVMVVGIATVGVSLQHMYHYMILAVVWGFYVAGIVIVHNGGKCISSFLLRAR